MSKKKPSEFVKKCRSWIIKNVIANYFKAYNLNADIYREHHAKKTQFDKLRQLTYILMNAKDDLYLVYNRLLDPRTNTFEKAGKYTPNEDEIRFINNIGILFHKSMVVRELVYMLQFYKTDNDPDYADIKSSLDMNVERLKTLFDKGVILIQKFLESYKNDPVVLSYFIENARYIEAIMGQSVPQLFKEIGHTKTAGEYFALVADYFRESGWHEKAKKVLTEALELEPKNRDILDVWAHYA